MTVWRMYIQMRKIWKIEFDKPVNAKEVSVAIESVYKGNKYNDTVISELSWF